MTTVEIEEKYTIRFMKRSFIDSCLFVLTTFSEVGTDEQVPAEVHESQGTSRASYPRHLQTAVLVGCLAPYPRTAGVLARGHGYLHPKFLVTPSGIIV